MRKKKINRERKRLQKRLERAEQYLTEHRREALTEVLQSAVATDYQKSRAERLLKKLDKRAEVKIENDKHLDALLVAFDQKHANAPSNAPANAAASATPQEPQPQPESVPNPVSVEATPELVTMDADAKAARIKVLEVEMKRIDFERSECAKLRMKLTDEQWERNWALFNEYHQLTDPPKPEPTPEEAEQIRKRKIFEEAQEKRIQEIKAEDMRMAGEWPTGRPDISYRLNLSVEQLPEARRMKDGTLQLYGTEKVPRGWEDRYQ